MALNRTLMRCAGSSEALLSGQKPPFRLFVCATHSDGSRANHIRFAVSEAFVVGYLRLLLITLACRSVLLFNPHSEHDCSL